MSSHDIRHVYTRTDDRTTVDDRNRGRLNSRSPGADRTPRPTQKRPPPVNPTLPPPAPRAPPRACSKAVGEMKARAGRGRRVLAAGGAAGSSPDELETREAEAYKYRYCTKRRDTGVFHFVTGP
jgi:hypothetical protein